MNLRQNITEDMKTAMRAKETARLSTLRLLLAAIKQREVDERITLDDTQINAVIGKMIKQRKDSVQQYTAAQRQDLADAEQAEINVLSAYLPAQATPEEIAQIIAAAIALSGATTPADMGKVMSVVKPKLAGRADMGEVSKAIKLKLAGA